VSAASTVHVSGVGFWSPGYRDTAAWITGAPDPSVQVAPAEILPTMLRRRASALARMAAEVASQAAREGAADLRLAPVVFGSVYGEIGAAVEMMREFRAVGGMPSPTRFHNSVHNSATGYLSIAAGNHGLATAIAAGAQTPAMALLEAMALLADGHGEAVVVLADEPIPHPFSPAVPYPPAAVAFRLSAAPLPATRSRLSGLRSSPLPVLPPPGGGIKGGGSLGAMAAHPCAGAFALLVAVARSAAGAVALGATSGGAWVVDVEPVSA
jgi:hypothetical protein